MTHVFCVEKIASLQAVTDSALRMKRHFGPPNDFPHSMLETVRKQLPTSKAVYKLECLKQPPRTQAERSVVLRIPQRNALFVELTRVADERTPASDWIYFGVDAAIGATNRLSPNLCIPFKKVDILLAGNWVGLSPATLASVAISNQRRAPSLREDAY